MPAEPPLTIHPHAVPAERDRPDPRAPRRRVAPGRRAPYHAPVGSRRKRGRPTILRIARRPAGSRAT